MLRKYVRVVTRAPIALGWTLGVHFVIRIRQALMPDRWGPHVRRPTDLVGLWGRGLSKIMGIRIIRINERKGPLGDIIVSNHMGFLDIPVLLSIFPAIFVIKMEMRKVFYLGQALADHGHIFVERGNKASQRDAAIGIRKTVRNGDRLIIFPEGKASPGAERQPFKSFSFREAARQKKRIEVCVIDYLPDRKMLEWDTSVHMVPQLVSLLGRKNTDISIEFFPSEIPEDGEEAALRYQKIVQDKLNEYDRIKAEKNETSI